ncbi:histidine phosphatase family protein [Calditrichota bacterium]
MKTIYLTRHAKSSWDYPELDDFERPLNERGRRDAPFMGSILKKLKIKPDAIVSSPATRAATTARIIANQLSYPLEHIYYNEILYGADETELSQIIKTVQETTKSIMIVGHNPGLTDFAHYIVNNDITNIPTSAVFGATLEIDKWKNFARDCGKFEVFEYPKKHKS